MAAENNHPYDVIHIGPYYCDLIFTGLPEMPQLGAEIFGTGLQLGPGGAFNTSYALHRLGLKTGWVTDFGEDFFSKYVLDIVNRLGMDTSLFKHHHHDLCAVTASFSYRHDRGFISYSDHFMPLDILPVIETHRPRCLLFGGLCLGSDFVELAQKARELGIRVIMDCQYRDVDLQTEGVREALEVVDVFLPNLAEAQRLTGKDRVEGALEVLAGLTPVVVVKMGGEGAAAAAEGQIIRVPGIHIDEVVDTTGAGDSFNAGFLYGYLRGAPLETCLKYANLCGGISVTGYGVSQIPDGKQIDALLESYAALAAGNTGLIPRQPPLGLTCSCKEK